MTKTLVVNVVLPGEEDFIFPSSNGEKEDCQPCLKLPEAHALKCLERPETHRNAFEHPQKLA